MSETLKPPHIETQDPGAHELSESDDHFSSADEGTSLPERPGGSASPIPTTRVERVDDEPAHGEVPNTLAYNMRRQDAVPDEIEVVPEGARSRSGTRSRAMSTLSSSSRSHTPGDSSVPKTVVERVDDKPAHGEVDGTLAKEMRSADAEPDEVRKAPVEARNGRLDGRGEDASVDSERPQAWFKSIWEGQEEQKQIGENHEAEAADDDEDDDDETGDDFDEFAEEAEDEDFGDFDEAEEPPSMEVQAVSSQSASDLLAGLPPLDFSDSSSPQAIDAYFSVMFPDHAPTSPSAQVEPPKTSAFLSDRSLSLWQQLVSPPPMAPPNWTRSRIRRLFLVSLGVPVDLDEILPPSKQKRLILPNINLVASPRPSAAIDRLRQHGGLGTTNSSTTSLDSKGVKHPTARRAATLPRGPPPPPDFDLNAATLLCSTTPEALGGLEDNELRDHVVRLVDLNQKASTVLEHWLERKDEGLKEKEALEGVIENLVGFVKGRRGK